MSCFHLVGVLTSFLWSLFLVTPTTQDHHPLHDDSCAVLCPNTGFGKPAFGKLGSMMTQSMKPGAIIPNLASIKKKQIATPAKFLKGNDKGGKKCVCLVDGGTSGSFPCEDEACPDCAGDRFQIFCRDKKIKAWEICICFEGDVGIGRCNNEEECKKCKEPEYHIKCFPRRIDPSETCLCVQRGEQTDNILFECNEPDRTCKKCEGEHKYLQCFTHAEKTKGITGISKTKKLGRALTRNQGIDKAGKKCVCLVDGGTSGSFPCKDEACPDCKGDRFSLFCRDKNIKPWETCICFEGDVGLLSCNNEEECKKCKEPANYLQCFPRVIGPTETCLCVLKGQQTDNILFECDEPNRTCKKCEGENKSLLCYEKDDNTGGVTGIPKKKVDMTALAKKMPTGKQGPGETCVCLVKGGAFGLIPCDEETCAQCVGDDLSLLCRSKEIKPWETCLCFDGDVPILRCNNDEECAPCTESGYHLRCSPREIGKDETCACAKKIPSGASILLFLCDEPDRTCRKCEGEGTYLHCLDNASIAAIK